MTEQALAIAEGLEELLVEVVAVGEHHDGGIVHFLSQHQFARVKDHRKALAAALRVPDDARAFIANGLFFDAGQAIFGGVFTHGFVVGGGSADGGCNGFVDRVILMIGGDLLDRLFSCMLKHNEMTDDIQHGLFVEQALDHRLQFGLGL